MQEHVNPPEERYRGVRRVLLVELGLNLLNATAKAVLGLWSGSIAIASDAVHSLMDGVNNIAGLVVLRAAERPPDLEHPYGHRKFETIAASVVGVAIALIAVRLGWTAIERLVHTHPVPETTPLGFAILIASLAINIFIAIYESRAAKRLQSEYLAADAAHTAADVLVTSLVILSFVGSHFGLRWADSLGALLVTMVIARVAWQVLSSSLAPLADTAAVSADDITQICLSVAGVRGCHRVRSRGTAHFAHVDLHLLLENSLSLREAHEIATTVEQSLQQSFPSIIDVTIHMEPEEDGFEPL